MLLKEQIKRQFDRAAHRYDSHALLQESIVDELIEAVDLQAIPLASSLIDVGCGTGYALQCLQGLRPDLVYTGLDIAPKMLDQLQARMLDVECVCADVENMPFENAQYDVLFSTSAIQWCQSGAVWQEISRVLTPGGRIAIATFLEGTLSEWRRFWMSEAELKDHAFVSSSELLDSITQAGLQPASIDEKRFSELYVSFDDAVQSVRGVGAGRASEIRENGLMGKQRFKKIKLDVENHIAEYGGVDLDYNVAFVLATKPSV